MGVLLQREQTQRRRTDRLLAELEAARDAEREAVALAERARLAREMHDVLAHTLSGLALQLEGVRLLAGSRQADPELTAAVERAGRLARGGLAEARRAIAALRGDALPGPELLPALVDQHRQAVGGRCRLEVRGQPRELPPDARLALYRTAQEALANVRKHAPGAAVDVRLTWDDDHAVLVVEDQADGGAGPPAAAGDGGYGLTGMAERAELLGGHLDAGPTAAGFRVELRLPVEAAA
jgi:signal transduction histidine kinase